MTDHSSILELSHNFNSDLVSPWIEDEVVQMDIYTASSLGEYDVVRNFINLDTEKKDMNKRNKGGWTPLMYAAYVGHENVLNLLLEHQVNVDARTTNKGATALMLAAGCGNEAVVYFLLQNGADINAMDRNGCNALFYAVFQGHQNVVKMLIDSGADMEKRENLHGCTPILYAAQEGHEGIFNLILKSGAKLTAKTTSGEDARSIALKCGHMVIVNLIDMQSYMHVPTSLLRSEAGLGTDDLIFHPELGTSPDARDTLILQLGQGSPGISIKDGPKAFASLRTSKQKVLNSRHLYYPNEGNQAGIDIKGKEPPANIAPTITSSPQLIPHSPRCGSYSNSFEDHFFAHSGDTVKNCSLNQNFERLNSPISSPTQWRSQPDTPEYPLLSEFLQDLKLTKYLSIFEEQEVDFETLITLSDADLKEIGITLFGPRRKIITAITKWKENPPIKKSSLKTLECELKDLRVQLQQKMLQLHQKQIQLDEEKDLRCIVEGCVVEEKNKNQQVELQWEKSVRNLKLALPELEEVIEIISHLCDKTNDDVTKEVFVKLKSSLEKIAGALQGSLKLVDSQSCSHGKSNMIQSSSSESIPNKSG